MSVEIFEAFKAELAALKVNISLISKKTVREESLLERFRTLIRTWTTIIRPTMEPLLKTKRDFLKLEAELEAIAQLTYKFKSVAEYRKRINKALELANFLVLYLPSTDIKKSISRSFGKDDLFIPTIPDLPTHLVPTPLLGWKSKMETFLNKNPFDKSVFIMIRYRKRNKNLIRAIKTILSENGHTGILASEHNLTDDLYNPIACLLSCSKGIAIFDKAEVGQEFNPNVAYELGMLHLLSRNCLILKHKSLESLHTDILMKLYHEYMNSHDASALAQHWIQSV